MAAVKLPTRTNSNWIGAETTFGTPPSMTQFTPLDTPDIKLNQAEVDNTSESYLLFDNKDHIHGLKDGSAKIEQFVRPHASQLGASTAPSTHGLGILLSASFGGKQATSGSTVTGAPTTGSVPVVTGTGVRFAVGQWALFPCSGTLEPARITAINSDTLTVFPALSSAPTSASVAVNMENYYPTQTNTQTVAYQRAHTLDTTMQLHLSGCLVDTFELSSDRGSMLKATFGLQAASWATGSLGLSPAVFTETLASPQVVKDAIIHIQATTDSTTTHYPLISHTFKTTLGNDFVMETGGIEGKTGIMRASAPRVFAEGTFKFLADIVQQDRWANGTHLQVIVKLPQGSGTTKRWVVIDMPTCIIYGKPQYSDDGGKLICEMTVRSQINTVITSPSTDLARSPFTLALG